MQFVLEIIIIEERTRVIVHCTGRGRHCALSGLWCWNESSLARAHFCLSAFSTGQGFTNSALEKDFIMEMSFDQGRCRMRHSNFNQPIQGAGRAARVFYLLTYLVKDRTGIIPYNLLLVVRTVVLEFRYDTRERIDDNSRSTSTGIETRRHKSLILSRRTVQSSAGARRRVDFQQPCKQNNPVSK